MAYISILGFSTSCEQLNLIASIIFNKVWKQYTTPVTLTP